MARRRLTVEDFAFAGAVPEVHNTPFWREGCCPTLYDGHWRAFPTELVRARGMFATQRRILAKHIDRYRRRPDSPPDGGTWPWVVEYRGKLWVLDGHHRIAEAGERDALVRVHLLHLTSNT